MTLDEMIARKKECGYSYEYIAEKSGVPASTVQKVLSKTTPSPRYTTLLALEKAFLPEKPAGRLTDDPEEKILGKEPTSQDPFGLDGKTPYFVREGRSEYDTRSVRESKSIYSAVDGTGALDQMTVTGKTIQDYLALPEGVRVELIDGEFYDLAAPTSLHQLLASYLTNVFTNFIDSNNGDCLAFMAPLDVQLDCDDKTMVQPDVLVVCDRKKITLERVVGVPDLIVEILSPSTWYHDTTRKLIKYKKAGVREYWIVMPRHRKILVYDYKKSDLPVEYTFEDKVPVSIWEGKCKVDFRKIYEKISFLL